MIKRRGISSVVGTVFAIIALASTVGYITYSMNVLDNYNQSILARNQQATDVTKEKFQVSSVTMVNNKLNITVVNTGSLPVNFTKIWITNKSATTTAWVKSYTPVNSLAAPGNTLTNLGQGVSTWLNTNYPYHIKLVTSRGNTNEFDVNSASTAPLNIQVMFIPSTTASGVGTSLVMIVTNNSTALLTNVFPSNLPNPTGSASCTAGSVSPSIPVNLPPGSTAVFKWDVTISAQSGSSQTCTYTLQTPLKNGYPQSMSATATVGVVGVSSSAYSQSTGVLTLNYTSFRWAATGQGGVWNKAFTWPHGTTTAFKVDITNNNATGKMWISKKTTLLFFSTHISPSQQPTPFYIVNFTNPSTLSSTTYNNCNGQNDYCLSIPPQGTVTMYLASNAIGTSGAQSFSTADINTAFLLVFGKFTTTQTGSGPEYAQNTPYIAADVT